MWSKMKEYLGSSELLTAMKDTMAVIIVDMDTWEIKGTTPLVERMFRYEPTELNFKHIKILIPDEYHERHAQFTEEYRRHPTSRLMGDRKLPGIRKDGSVFSMSIWLLPHAKTNSVLVVFFE